jgi:hypothetical protein
MRHGERCNQAGDFQWRGFLFFFCERRGFRLLEKPKSQLSLELGSCHLGDRAGDICDPGYTRQRDPMCAIKV